MFRAELLPLIESRNVQGTLFKRRSDWGDLAVNTVSKMLLGDAATVHPRALEHCPILGFPLGRVHGLGSTVWAPSNTIPVIVGKCLEMLQQGASAGTLELGDFSGETLQRGTDLKRGTDARLDEHVGQSLSFKLSLFP